MDSIEKSIAKRVLQRRQYDKRVNEKRLQIQEEQANTVKALEANLVVAESSGTESEKQDDSSRSV
jgi:hypothetical protein